MTSYRDWDFSLITNDLEEKSINVPQEKSKVTFYHIEGIFPATVYKLYNSQFPETEGPDYIVFEYKKGKKEGGCCRRSNGITHQSHLPLTIVIQIGTSSYAGLGQTNGHYIASLITVMKEWDSVIGKENIAMLEKGFISFK